MSIETPGAAVCVRGSHHLQVYIELKCIKAERQAFTDRFQCRFFKAPELKERSAFCWACSSDTLSLGLGEILLSKFHRFRVICRVLNIYSYGVCRRPGS